MEKKSDLDFYELRKIEDGNSRVVKITMENPRLVDPKVYEIQYRTMGGYKVKSKNGTIIVRVAMYKSLSEFAKMLNTMWTRGRYLEGYDNVNKSLVFGTFDQYNGARISYRQVKKLLRFENLATAGGSFPHEAIEHVDPKRLPNFLDLGDYAIEVWKRPKSRRYSYITDNSISKKWIEKLVRV